MAAPCAAALLSAIFTWPSAYNDNATLGIDDAPMRPGPCSSPQCTAFSTTAFGPAERAYIRLLEMALTGSLHDEAGSCGTKGPCPLDGPHAAYDPRLRSYGRDWPTVGHTLVGHKRLRNVREAITLAVATKVPGDYAELGVWRGGTCIYAAGVFEALGQHQRSVHVFDAFDALPAYGPEAAFLATSVKQVRHNFAKYGLLDENRVRFHKGLFEESLGTFVRTYPHAELAVLRLDCNYYSSYQHALYTLWDRVPVGGILIFDDFGHNPATKFAWLDFARAHGLSKKTTWIHPIDMAAAGWARKSEAIPVDRKHFLSTEQIIARLKELKLNPNHAMAVLPHQSKHSSWAHYDE